MSRIVLTEDGIHHVRWVTARRRVLFEEIADADHHAREVRVVLIDGTRLTGRTPNAEKVEARVRDIVRGAHGDLNAASSFETLSQGLTRAVKRTPFVARAFVDALLQACARLDVSDLHIEPRAGGARFAARRDGALHELVDAPAPVVDRVVGRLRVLARLPAHRTDTPGEGRAVVEGAGDLRVSVVPGLYGLAVAVRFFDRFKQDATLRRIVRDSSLRAELLRAIEPQGLTLVCGRASSGKSTTACAVIRTWLASSEARAVTIEDPVEAHIDGAVQLEVDAAAGRSYEALLRTCLRQDAHIIGVGEIRDAATARLTLEAGLTGHRVVSTLHAGSIADALRRLTGFGLDSATLHSALRCVIVQDLEPRPCASCEGSGCDACHATGVRRSASLELSFGDRLREEIRALTARPENAP